MLNQSLPHLKEHSYTIGVFLALPIIDQYINEYRTASDDTIITSDANFADAIPYARKWEEQGVDVFISRRGTGEFLRKNFSTPVLTLPLSELEIVHSLRQGCTRGARVLIPVYGEPYSGLSHLENLIGISIVQQVYNNFEELQNIVQKAAEGSMDHVAGGGATQRLAQKYGIPFIYLSPSREQFFSILASARNVAGFNREKEALIQEMQCLMDSMVDGFLSVDRAGNILSCNNVAVNLLQEKKAEQLIGASIFSYMNYELFQSLLQEKQSSTENIIDIKGTSLIINLSFIKSRHTVERTLITLRKVQDVIRQSGSIRSAISRGFEAHYRLRDMIHKSPTMHHVLDLCKVYCKTDSSILICGETGTGKEILSQGIHNRSKRRKKPFVSINCTELPEHLLESELFGYDEGAFTGSRKGGKAGFFELAHSGTILLDEIDSATPLVQGKLLRVLQEKEIMRIGGKRKIPVDVRILATSGRDLWEQVCLGHFRKDLFFRLNVMVVHIPPLRKRPEDLDVLLPHFLNYFMQREEIKVAPLTREHMHLLKTYTWPGNVRQLRHFAERFVLYSSFMHDPFSHLFNEFQSITFAFPQGTQHTAMHTTANINPLVPVSSLPNTQHMPQVLPNEGHMHIPPSSITPISPVTHADHNTIHKGKDEVRTLQTALEQAHYSKQEAARILGISRSTLWRKLKQYDMC